MVEPPPTSLPHAPHGPVWDYRRALGRFEGWKPPQVGSRTWGKCPWNCVLGRLDQDMANSWLAAHLGCRNADAAPSGLVLQIALVQELLDPGKRVDLGGGL